MSWKNSSESSRTLFYSAAVLCLTVAALFFTATVGTDTVDASSSSAAPAATFPGVGAGPIPDGGPGCGPAGAPLNITFNVTGLEGAPTAVSISMDAAHTWMGDVTATLIAPDGTEHVVFGRTGHTAALACGDSSNLGAVYNFTDTATGTNWWTQANTLPGSNDIMPAGDYRTTQGGPQPVATTSPVTSLNDAFAGVSNPNGTWTLRVTDSGGADLGSVAGANLTLEGGGGGGGSEWTNIDVDGDGQTDYGLVREAGGGALYIDQEVRMTARQRQAAARERASLGGGGTLTWYTATTSDNTIRFDEFGNGFDTIVPNDYDGDGKTDIAVWRTNNGVGEFHIFESSTSTVRIEEFGQEGDDPAVTADYDGDGSADVAVYRCPITAGQCSFFYRGSLNNPGGTITFVPWGTGSDGDFYPAPGDYDGDGKADFCIQRSHPTISGGGQFVLLRSSNGGVEFINWGYDTDFIIPGDYDGDGQTDIAIRRNDGGQHVYWVLTRAGSVIAAPFGVTGDISVPGDYDGDGSTDFATWRSSSDPDQNYFYVYRSSDSTMQAYEFGAGPQDVPMAAWLVH